MSKFPKACPSLLACSPDRRSGLGRPGSRKPSSRRMRSADPFHLGRPATEDGDQGLGHGRPAGWQGPAGGPGNGRPGEKLFMRQLRGLSWRFGEGAAAGPCWPAARERWTARPEKTVGSYWPYLSTVFDYIHRAMPFGKPGRSAPTTLRSDRLRPVPQRRRHRQDFELNNEEPATIKMPNEQGFYMDDRAT